MGKVEYVQNENVRIRSATKLMEQLSVSERKSLAVAQSKIKNVLPFGNDDVGMCLAVETEDQSVLVYQVEPGTEALASMDSGLIGHDVAAGLDQDGRICLFAVKGDRLYSVQELAPASGQFSAAIELAVTRPSLNSTIERLLLYPLTQDAASPFVLAVVLKSGTSRWLDLRYWNVSQDQLFPVPLTTQCFTFSGNERTNLKLRVLEWNYGVYDVTTGEVESSVPVKWPLGEPKGMSIQFVEGNAFVLHQDTGRMEISILLDDETGGKKALFNLFSDSSIHCFHVWGSADSVSFAVHTDMICHGMARLSGGAWRASSLDPLARSAYCLRVFRYQGAMQMFYLTEADELLHRLEDMDGQNWNETQYEALEPGTVSRQSCYSTELTLTDPKHRSLPLSGVEVRLHAESRTYVETAAGISMIDKNHFVTMVTDQQGKLFFRQYTNRLDVPILYAALPGSLLSENEELSFSQFSDVYQRIGGVSGNDLMSAQQMDSHTAEETPLIPDKYRTQSTADQLAGGLQKLVQSFSDGETAVMCLREKGLPRRGQLRVREGLPAWRMCFAEDGSAAFEELTPEQAEARVREFRNADGAALPKWLTSIGDFFRSVVKSIVKVCEVIINGVKAAVRFVLNGVEMVFEAVLSVVQDVLKFVEILFAPVLVLFKQLFRWLAELFGWNYVLYTKKAVIGLAELMLDWLPRNADALNAFLCGGIAGAQKQLDDWIDRVIASVAPDQGLMDYGEKNLPEEKEDYTYAVSNDPLQAKLGQALNSGAAGGQAPLPTEVSDSIRSIYERLMQFVKTLGGSGAFQEAGEFFSKALQDIDHFFSFMLEGILTAVKELLHLVLDGCSAIVSGLSSVVEELLSGLWKVLTAKIKFPLLSEIYSWISGDDLTILDLAALFTALPATLIGKAACGSVPFSTEEEIDAFIAEIQKYTTPDWTPGMEPDSGLGDPPKAVQMIVKVIAMGSALSYGVVNTMLDGYTAYAPLPEDDEEIFAGAALALEAVWWAASFPLIYDYSTLDKDEKFYTWIMWMIFTEGLIIDGVQYCQTKRHVDAETIGRQTSTVYGCMHLCAAVAGISLGLTDVLSFLAELFGACVEATRWGLDFESIKRWAIIIDAVGAAAIFCVNCEDIVSSDADLSAES